MAGRDAVALSEGASTSETRPFPGPPYPGLYLQTILVTPLPPVIAQRQERFGRGGVGSRSLL